jgi:hypothetical protein
MPAKPKRYSSGNQIAGFIQLVSDLRRAVSNERAKLANCPIHPAFRVTYRSFLPSHEATNGMGRCTTRPAGGCQRGWSPCLRQVPQSRPTRRRPPLRIGRSTRQSRRQLMSQRLLERTALRRAARRSHPRALQPRQRWLSSTWLAGSSCMSSWLTELAWF